MKRRSYLIRVGDAISQLINTVLLNGEPNESTSARAYRCGWQAESIINFFLGKTHCRDAFYADLIRMREYLKNQETRKRD